MRVKLLVIYIIILTTFSLNARNQSKENAWSLLLKDVKIGYIYSLKYDALLPKPRFGKELKKLDGQTITIKGFFLPLDLTGDLFVISYNPMSTCFFCTGTGLQSIIELNVLPEHLKKFKRLRTDNYFQVKGKLRLNADTSEHLIYILDEVEFVQLIK